jgi:hypothetical protein
MRSRSSAAHWPHRRALLVTEVLVSLAGLEGAAQLALGIATPPDADLPGFLGSWLLPGLWLFGSVAVPSAAAAWLLQVRSPLAPAAVLLAAAALALELLVQIPFLGLSVLQAVLGAVAVATAALGLDARHRGWPGSR